MVIKNKQFNVRDKTQAKLKRKNMATHQLHDLSHTQAE